MWNPLSKAFAFAQACLNVTFKLGCQKAVPLKWGSSLATRSTGQAWCHCRPAPLSKSLRVKGSHALPLLQAISRAVVKTTSGAGKNAAPQYQLNFSLPSENMVKSMGKQKSAHLKWVGLPSSALLTVVNIQTSELGMEACL